MSVKFAALPAALAFAALLLAGCSTALQPQGAPESGLGAQAASASSASESSIRYRERIEVVVQRMRAACVAADYQPYFRKTACLPLGITDQQMRDSTKITSEQKRAATAVFELTKELNEETRRIMRETNDKALSERAEVSQRLRDPQINAIQDDLLTGRSTWGQYNKARRALAEAVRQDLQGE